MIKLGHLDVSLYPDGGISWDNNGIVEFKGRCTIGKNSFISIGRTGKVIFGENFTSTNSLKLTSYECIKFGKDVLCGWECIFIDTDFHKLSFDNGKPSPLGYGKISIGDCCWFGFRCIVLKNTIVPNSCVIASNSLLNKEYKIPSKSLIAGQPAKLKTGGVYRNPQDDRIHYTKVN